VACRLITVNTIRVPEGVDGAALSAFAMERYALEVAGGLGPTVGKVWRIGEQGRALTPLACVLPSTLPACGLACLPGWPAACLCGWPTGRSPARLAGWPLTCPPG
jgi:hypothetical protein